MDVSNHTFDQMKKRIVQKRKRYFPNDLAHLVSISTEKAITPNTRRNPKVVKEENMACTITTQDNTKYLE